MFVALRSRFVATAYSILLNQEDAEEAVQDAFLSAHCHLGNFEGRSALRTWLTRIVLNSALMTRRKRKSAAINSFPDSDGSLDEDWTEKVRGPHKNPEVIYAERETFEFIDGILDQMRPVLRQAFTMTYYDDLSSDDMRANLVEFLREVVPVAAENGVRLAIHPDDPPFSLFGLPRVVSQARDIQTILDAVRKVC